MKANLPETSKKRIVIIGAGFAGLTLAKNLVKLDYQIVLLDKNNYHQFQPLLYQVATGGLEAGAIAYPIRKIFNNKQNIHIRLAEVTLINNENKTLETNIGKIWYDYLVIATGAENNYFGNKNLENNCIGMKNLTEALDIRSLLLQNMEKALLIEDEKEKDSYLNIVIIGGGPTGVELAGALSEMKKYILPKDYPELDFNLMDIHLIESNERVLAAMDPISSEKAKKYLLEMGVKVENKTRVNDYDGTNVILNNGTQYTSKTVVWAAGIRGKFINGLNIECINKSGRYICNENLSVKGYENIFAIGDIACIITEKTPNGNPQLATVAMQQGEFLFNIFKNLEKNINNKFVYKNKGVMATVGRNKAVVELPYYKFGGYFAWLIWMFIHLMSLVGFRNRLSVFVTWLYNYLNYEKALRLIIRPYKKTN
ncbi:MAG: NAD(P)/FAD-dependent oxidoreductase [Cytophagales bacterium]